MPSSRLPWVPRGHLCHVESPLFLVRDLIVESSARCWRKARRCFVLFCFVCFYFHAVCANRKKPPSLLWPLSNAEPGAASVRNKNSVPTMDTAKVKGNDTTIFSCNSLSGIFYLFIQHSLLVLSLGCMFWHISMALFTVQRVKLFLKSLQASLFLACLSSLVVPPEAISVWRLRTTGKPLCVCGNNMRRMTSHLTLRSPGLAHFFQTSFHGNIPENWNSLIVVILLLFCTELVINLVRTLVVKLTNWKTRKVLLSAICLAILNALSQRLIFSKFHNSSVFPSLGNVLLQSHCSCSSSKKYYEFSGKTYLQ